MDSKANYYNNIQSYYKQSLNAYKDGWAMDEAQAIHYGYWDSEVSNFAQSLGRMNEVMAAYAKIKQGETVLDAGCGVGGSSIFLAQKYGCNCIGITLSTEQLLLAQKYSKQKNVEALTHFEIMDYTATKFDDESFDVVWGCESICYAYDKQVLLKEVFRVLKKGGRFIMADGMVPKIDNNNHKTIAKWLNGWQVNYLETPENWLQYGKEIGFQFMDYKDITPFTKQSSLRLLLFSLAGLPYILYNKIFGKKKWTAIQKNNIYACWHQYWGMKKGLWNYGMIVMEK
jgi:tocopherol O-methyltransferase